MLKTKSCKIILFVTAIVMFVLAMVCLIPTAKVVNAQSEASTYFTKDENSKMLLRNDGVELFDMVNNSYIQLKNDITLDNLAFDTYMSTDVKKATITFKTGSFFVGGDTVEHKLVLERGSELDFNGVKGVTIPNDATSLKIYFKVEKGDVSVSIFDANTFTSVATDEYKSSDIDKCVAENFKFAFEVEAEGSEKLFRINTIDQDYTDATGTYLQEFKLDETNTLIKKSNPMISLHGNEKMFVFDGEQYLLKAERGKRYTVNFKAYSIVDNETTFGGVKKVNETDNIMIADESIPDEVRFDEVGEQSLSVKIGPNEQIVKFNVVDSTLDSSAPIYFDNEYAVKLFVEKLAETTIVKDGDLTHSIKLGEQVTIPSLKNLVGDDFTAYENLTISVCYSTPKTSSTTSTMALTLDAAGRYFFYVIFTDKDGNAMDKEKYEEVVENYQGEVTDSDDENRVHYYKVGAGADVKYFFSFDIKDDAPVSVTAPKQANGYIGTTYNASEFTIQYQSYTPTYELYYNKNKSASVADLTANGWVKISKSSEVSSSSVIPSGFTYEEIKAINYDGALKFTPDREGKYAIKCTVASTMSVRADYAVAEIIISEEPEVVRPASKWLQENVWTVVFLSVGTLCLVGIILLIFVKPKKKEQTKEEEVDE